MANDYCTLAEVQAGFPDSALATTTDTAFTGLIESMISRASRLIDREVGKEPGYFYPSTDDQTRYYDGSGTYEQDIDDCLTITTVSVAEDGGRESTSYTDWGSTDYYAEPYNYSALAIPITLLMIETDGGKPGWYRYKKSVKVAGIFGYSVAVPDDINEACIIKATLLYMASKQGYMTMSANTEVGSMSVGDYEKRYKEILWLYKVRNQV